MGNDFQWSLETVIPLSLSLSPVWATLQGNPPTALCSANTSLIPSFSVCDKGKNLNSSTLRVSATSVAAESPWLPHPMCSCYVMDCSECFIDLLYLSCSCILRHTKSAGHYSWPLSYQCKHCYWNVIAVLLAVQRDDIFTNMKCIGQSEGT